MALKRLRERLARATGTLRRDQRGAAAVEFAFIATPFLALVFGILELGLAFFTQQAVETATLDAARLLRTGQASTANMTRDQFRDQICAGIPSFLNCSDKIRFRVVSAADFTGIDGGIISPFKNGTFDESWGDQNASWTGGLPGEVMLVQVAYPIPTFTNFFGASLANRANGEVVLTASAAFRNEP